MAFGSSILGWNLNTRIPHKTLTQFTINSQLVAAPSSQSHALLRLGFHPPLLCFFFCLLYLSMLLYVRVSLFLCVIVYGFEYKEKKREWDRSDDHKKFKLNRPECRVLYILENFACRKPRWPERSLSLSVRKLFHILFPSKQGIRCVRFLFIFP